MGRTAYHQPMQKLEEERLVSTPGPAGGGLHLAVEAPELEDGSLLEQIRLLPAKYRQVIYLRYYEGYEVQEIAQLLGRSPGLVSTHLARAKIKLREQLEGTCYEV